MPTLMFGITFFFFWQSLESLFVSHKSESKHTLKYVWQILVKLSLKLILFMYICFYFQRKFGIKSTVKCLIQKTFIVTFLSFCLLSCSKVIHNALNLKLQVIAPNTLNPSTIKEVYQLIIFVWRKSNAYIFALFVMWN
jgi:hypothetical protein